jgi:hypothetical protein
MATRTYVREVLVGQVLALAPSLNMPIFWENRESADLDKIKVGFLEVIVDFTETALISTGGIKGHSGLLVLAFYTREGEGTVKELEVGDLLDQLSVKHVGGVHTGAMTPGTKKTKQGWRRTEWLVPFSFYS